MIHLILFCLISTSSSISNTLLAPSCTSCLAEFPKHGWCSNVTSLASSLDPITVGEGACLLGTINGPTGATCSDWHWVMCPTDVLSDNPPTPTPETTPTTPEPTPTPTPTLTPGPTPLVIILKNYWYFIPAPLVSIVMVLACCYFKRPTNRRYRRRYESLSSQAITLVNEAKIDPSQLECLEVIGIGRASCVYRGYYNKDTVAIKVFRNCGDSTQKQVLMIEASIMMQLDHVNILQFLGVCLLKTSTMLVTSYMSKGSLATIIHDHNMVYELEHIRSFAVQTCRGMSYLHSKNIIHRDLKPSNLLIDEDWTVKVCDFGLSRALVDASVTQTLTACGTPCWVAPEVYTQQRYSFKADVYSFAICLWELCSRRIPFKGMTTPQIILTVVTDGKRPPVDTIQEEFVDVIKASWDSDPRKRPLFTDLERTLEELDLPTPSLEHPVLMKRTTVDSMQKEEIPL